MVGATGLALNRRIIVPALSQTRYGTIEYRLLLQGLNEATARVPDRPEAYFLKARTLLVLERPDEARTALDEALQADGGFVPARLSFTWKAMRSPAPLLPGLLRN